MTLQDIVKTAVDGKIDRLKVGHVLAELTLSALTLGYITPCGSVTEKGILYLSQRPDT